MQTFHSIPLSLNSAIILSQEMIDHFTIMLPHKAFFAISMFIAYVFFPSVAPAVAKSDKVQMPSFAFSWSDGVGTFAAGELATIKVKVLGNFERAKYKYPFNPNITVNNKMGNSTLISGVSSYFGDGDLNNWRVSFIPILVGLFNVLITDDKFNVLDSSLHFQVTPGKRYPAAGTVSWLAGVDEFIAGTKATILILPRDAFGNNISSASEGKTSYDFTVLASHSNDSVANVLNITNKGWNHLGYLSIEFIVATSGSLLLNVQEQNQSLIGSPLSFEVMPGGLDVANCSLRFNIDTKSFQLFSVMEGFILQHDLYGNPVPGFYAFDVEVMAKGTNLSMPVSDLLVKEVELGVQFFSFKLVEPGNFTLLISDKGHNGQQDNLISNVPYDFTVYIGYCDGNTSIVNGSGLYNSFAGEAAKFSIFLRDAYLYPSPIDLERIQVQILHEFDSETLHSNIRPMKTVNGNFSTEILTLSPSSHVAFAPPAIMSARNESLGNSGLKFSAFEVIFVPEKCGIYQISIFCGNIELNDGVPFRKVVNAGKVNLSLSGVVKYAPKVSKLIKNEIVVHLVDSYSNPVQLQHSKLKLQIASVNRSGFSTWMFVDNNDGSYTGSYLAKDVGTYEICASFDGHRFLPCPFGVNVYSNEYFPRVFNDTVNVWEDESIAFDALENDYIPGGNASIVEFSKPLHGSLLQNGRLLRYTPYRGFYGNDSFFYTIADINGNIASGLVNISILCAPPQFLSFPSQLLGTEDIISPMFGGFSGFEIAYSDIKENITVVLNAISGTIFLSAMPMQFWLPIWGELYVKNDIANDKALILAGTLEVVNFALQGIQYFGNENFYGKDTIRVSTMNRNGKNNLDFPIFVEPINDPPFINVPPFIVFEDSKDEVLIFDGQKDEFDFFIGDPDLLNFPGNKSRFLVVFSLEVSSGYLTTSLPSVLVNTTEIKLTTSYQWRPLQTFVTISKHFTVKAKGIRFRGTISDCNNVMQHLLYQGGKHGAFLTAKVNDMGNYGCYPNCDYMMSTSLFAEATVNLIRKRPMSSLLAHSLGSVIVMEFIVVLSLGVVLLMFICKCAIVLIREKKRDEHGQIELSKVQYSHENALSPDLTGKATQLSPLIEGENRNGKSSSKQEMNNSIQHFPVPDVIETY